LSTGWDGKEYFFLDNWQPTYWLIILAGVYLVYAFTRSNLVWNRGGKKYIEVLKRVAETTGLTYTAGSFAPRSAAKPLVSGKYQKRQVSIVVDTFGKWSFADSILKISLSLENKPTAELPQGAFFVVGDPRKKHFWDFLLPKPPDQDTNNVDVREFPMKCVPQNLGNHLISFKCVQELMRKPQPNDILITKGFVYYRQVGLEDEENVLLGTIQCLLELATGFERFYKNWIT
jgi:hypothetical protein